MHTDAPAQNLATHRPVKLILDTDMGNDIDDALALAMIHSMEARGECELLGVMISKDHPAAPAMVDAINTFYGRGDIAIGMVQNGVTNEPGQFNEQVLAMTDEAGKPLFPTTHAQGSYEPAVAALRRLLAHSEDRSVVIMPIGPSTNLHQLFDSQPDDISPLDGKALFAQKVSHVVMMAGCYDHPNYFDNPNYKEYNINMDLPASTRFIADCPTPIFFTGFEIGDHIKHPVRSILNDYHWTKHHPVVEAYKFYLEMPYDRPTWDLTAVLYATRPDRDYFTVSEPGKVKVDEAGVTSFTADPQGNHYKLSVTDMQIQIVRQVQVELSSQPVLR